MNVVATALKCDPTIAGSLRLFTIATNLMYEDKNGGDGEKPNWNGASRDEVFETYPELWWVESDWTYNAMFDRPEFEAGEPVGGPPVELLRQLASVGGALGAHIKDVVAHERVRWARYFRGGDTPSVLYVIDADHDLDDPTEGSWAGRYHKPFPDERPQYWTGIDGAAEWNYAEPRLTWANGSVVFAARKQTLLDRCPAMYVAFLEKVRRLYGAN